MKLRYLLALALVALAGRSLGQIYPLQCTPQLIPPYSVYLSDYATPGSEKLRVILIQKDLTQASYQFRLVMSIELNGKVIMRTSRSFNPGPITIDAGIPTIISGNDLEPYLNSRNIDFIGYSREQYEKTRALPEGSYRIMFTAYDYARQDVQVSNEGSSFYYLSKNEPPMINFPMCGTRIPIRNPQQIIFSWLPRNTASPTSASDTEYEFKLYETRPPGRNPNDVILTTPPIYEAITQQPQLVFGPAEPMLIENMQYVWRVQARDINGKDAFRNNGFSEVCTFVYAGSDITLEAGVVEQLQAEGLTDRTARIWWSTSENNEAYRVEYRKSATGNSAEYEWFRAESKGSELKLFDLEPDVEYETRAQVIRQGVLGPFTDVVKFRTSPLRVIQCGDAPSLLASATGKPLMYATTGMFLQARGMEVVLQSVSNLGEDGWYRGTGRVTIPYLGGATFHATFDRVFIDAERNVTAGRINLVTKGVAAMAEEQLSQQVQHQQKNQQEENREVWAGTQFHEQIFKYDDVIQSIVMGEDDQVVVYDQRGLQQINYDVPAVLASAPEKAVIVEDKDGNQWVIQKDKDTGQTKVTKVEGGGLLPGSAPANPNVPASNASQKEKELIAEILQRFQSEIAAVLHPVREPVFPRGGPAADDTFEPALPTCMPDDQEQLEVVSGYLAKLKEDEKFFDAFTYAVYQNESHKQTIVSVAQKTTLSGGQKYGDVLSSEDLEKVEDALCSHASYEAKKYAANLWWLAPHWERAAKVLKEHFEDLDFYEDVSVECTDTYCKTIGIVKIADDVSATVEVTFTSTMTPAEVWKILDEHRVDFWQGRSAVVETYWEALDNWLAMKDDNLYQGKGWESEFLKGFADVLMAAPGAVHGWTTGKHWRTGDELATWEHILGVLDVFPMEVLAKAGITGLVLKVGSKFIDVTKLTTPVKSFILSAYKSGLKLVINTADDIIIYAANGTQKLGRFLNGVLQEIYWVYGGERILAKLAGIKYMVDPTAKKIVDGTLEVVENGKTIGVRTALGAERLFKNIDAYKAAVAKGDNVFYVGGYTDIVTRPAGVQAHHGVNTVWMEANFSNYSKNKAPAVYMFNEPNHNSTRSIFNSWRVEIKDFQGVKDINSIDFSKITKDDILKLAERQFDAADVPKAVRDDYYKLWEEYLATLTPIK